MEAEASRRESPGWQLQRIDEAAIEVLGLKFNGPISMVTGALFRPRMRSR